ncbi:MAG: malto-oligosyltrehalose synthase [Devosia sp.]
MSAAPPRATYRLQLTPQFRFTDVAALAPYLARFGISHVYLSPITRARSGSTHGYDVVDHGAINPELGTPADFESMAAALRAEGLGIILDIVPNHMGVGGDENRFWLDVLKHGEASRYAGWFDIDWHPPTPGLDGKLLVPFLGVSYGEALENGVLELRRDAVTGDFAVWAHDHHCLPLSPATSAGLGDADVGRLNADKAALDALIARQHWRPAKASVADDEINYRRFFIVSDLAGIRVERDDVFEYVHRLPLDLLREGLIDGLRVDHIDGLYDPRAYCRRLRELAGEATYIVVEKILAEDEPLRADWSVDGTTGYEFSSLVIPLLVDPKAEVPLTRFYRRFCGVNDTPAEIEHAMKRRIMDRELAAELSALSWRFARLAVREPATQDITRRALRAALRAFITTLPVYRTNVDAAGPSPADHALIDRARRDAGEQHPEVDAAALDFVADVLRAPGSGERLDAALRLQQFTGPVMAKGLEDTALYRFNRLIALNDVGERPDRFTLPVEAFHAANAERARAFPRSILGTSSHDSKRGEDTRCRIAALSGRAGAWTTAVPTWFGALRAAGAPSIHPDDAYLFFQLLVGAWPGAESGDLKDRMIGAMRKSLREARLRSDWAHPDEEYEEKVASFVTLALEGDGGQAFRADFERFEARLGPSGLHNSLIQTTLKLTVPGVPDIYQGAELFEQSMVDPDNRRPVDFAVRQDLLRRYAEGPLDELLDHWRDGAIKLALTARLLGLRKRLPEVFARGTYEPIPVSEEICAFLRRHGANALLVAVRLYPWRKLAEPTGWRAPAELHERRWTDALAGGAVDLNAGWPLFRELPVSVLVGD